MADHASYLSRINFDEKLRNTWFYKYLGNFRLVILLIISIIAVGIINYYAIPRRLNPEVKIPIVIVSTVLPGANPEDVESLVTIPLEDQLKSVENLDTITSSSRDNVSVIVMQFLSSVDPKDARSDVQQAVDTVNDLPEDAIDPNVSAIDFENQPVWNFALTGPDEASLNRLANTLEDNLTNESKIDRVVIAGKDQRVVEVELNPTKVAEYGLSPLQLSQAVSAAAGSFPAGNIRSNGSNFSLAIDASIDSIQDIRDLKINTDGQVISLGDISTITETTTFDQARTYLADADTQAKSTVQFFVYKTTGSNISEAEEQAQTVVEETLKPFGDRFQIITVSNSAQEIETQFEDLIHEFGVTIVLIFTILLVFLGLKQAIIASLTVPLTFLSAVAVANMMGQSLNFLTMFAFLIALGLLIDDTIVAVTAMTRYHESGKFTPLETGALVWRDFIVPLWSTTITTIWSFLPLLLATGIIGEFIKPIPIIVTATMLSSTSIAVFITIPLMIVVLKLVMPRRVRVFFNVLFIVILVGVMIALLPRNAFFIPLMLVSVLIAALLYLNRSLYIQRIQQTIKNDKRLSNASARFRKIVDSGIIDLEALSIKYMRVITSILDSATARKNTLIFLIVFAVVAYMLVPFGLVKNEFFPKTDGELIYISVTLPTGTNIQTTSQEALAMLDTVRKTPDVQYVVAEPGTNFDASMERSNEPNSFLLTLNLGDLDERERDSIEIAEALRAQFKDYRRGTVTVSELSGGPPAGADIQIQLLGDDLNTLNLYADKLVTYLNSQEGATNANKSVKPGTGKITFVPNDAELAAQNIDRNSLGLTLRTFASGFTLDTIRFDEETDVVLRLSGETPSVEALGEVSVPTQTGSVPLLSLGELKLENNPTLITRDGGDRSISVTATSRPGYNLTEVNAELEKFAEEELNLPEGYSWKTGGVNEENDKSVQSIINAMALSFLLITITMVIEFGSFRQALMVMLTIPLAVSGVFYVFGLTGTPLSFPALIGVLALFGIVVTNAIVVVEKINDNLRDGMKLRESIIDAAGSRLEPVILTSLATIFGLLPITISDPLWRGLGGAIIAGLMFSGLIKLFFIPIVYYEWYKEPETKKKNK